MRHLKKLVFALVVALAPIAVPSPASALRPYWPTCPEGKAATGQLDFVEFSDGSEIFSMYLHARGRITPCKPPTDREVFAVAVYSPDGARGVASYYRHSVDEQGRFAAGFDRNFEGWRAVCLISQPNVRLDCLAIGTQTGDDGVPRLVAGERIPVDAPLVARPASVYLGQPRTPECPSCW